jgi:hypothetical protein
MDLWRAGCDGSRTSGSDGRVGETDGREAGTAPRPDPNEWAKNQAAKAGIAFTELANGFATCEDPERLQQICHRLGPNQITAYFERWMRVIPTPLRPADRAAGYFWELSMRQIEVSRTLTFDAPRHARSFFEATVRDNLDLGRPDEVKLIFSRQIYSNTKSEFATRLVTRGTDVTLSIFYKHSRIKEYLKEGRALRIETVVNSPTDLGVQRRLHNLAELVGKARAANRRLLDVQRAGQGCAIESALLERISQPSLKEGHRTGALRFGEPRAMALAGALSVTLNGVVGFTNRSLRAQVSQLLGAPYSSSQMTYDLRRLRLKELVERLPHSNTYILTHEGTRFALFYTISYERLLRPLLAANRPPAPLSLQQALQTIERAVDDYVVSARLQRAA